VLNGKALTLALPTYPVEAREQKAGGGVNVQVTIDEQGNIISAKAVSGDPLLRAASEEAARNSKFAPTTLKGVPVKVTGVIYYNFVP
jgi:protein TonB